MLEEGLKIRIGAVIDGVTEAINSIKTAMAGLNGPIAKAQAAFVLFNKVLLASVIGVIVVALVQLVRVFRDNETAMKKLQPLLIGLERIGGGIFRAFEPVLDAFISIATKALPYLTKGIGILYSSLFGLFTLLKQSGQGVGKILKGIFTLDAGLVDSGVKQLSASVIVSVDAAVKAFDRYEVGLTDLTETEKKNAKKNQKDREKAQREADALLKDQLTARKELLESELAKVGELTDEYLRLKREIRTIDFKINIIGKKGGQSDLKAALENDLKSIEADFKSGKFNEGKIDFTSFFDLDFEGIRERFKSQGQAAKNAFEEALKTAGKVSGKVEIIPSDSVKKAITGLSLIDFETQKVADSFNSFLAPAVDTVFGALENGANIFQAIGAALKAMVAQLIVSIAKSAILAGILSALNLAAPGSGGAVKGFGAIFSSLLGFGRLSAPNLGGLGRGGLELAGQVVFRQSGTDLVGVLNAGNGQIRRTG